MLLQITIPREQNTPLELEEDVAPLEEELEDEGKAWQITLFELQFPLMQHSASIPVEVMEHVGGPPPGHEPG